MPAASKSRRRVWIISGAFIGIAVILLVIGMIQLMDSSPVGTEHAAIRADTEVLSGSPQSWLRLASIWLELRKRGDSPMAN